MTVLIGGLPAEVYANAMAQQRTAIASALIQSLSIINRVDKAQSPPPPPPATEQQPAPSNDAGGGLLGIAKFIGGFIPVVSSVISFYDAYQAFKGGNVGSGLMHAASGIMGLTGASVLAKVAHLATKSARLKQGADIVRRAADNVTSRFAKNPGELATKWLSPGELSAAQKLPFLQNRAYGRGFERAVADELRKMGAPLNYTGGRWGPDFFGTGPLKGFSFELTTPGSVASHLGRWNPAQAVITYERPLPVSAFFGQ